VKTLTVSSALAVTLALAACQDPAGVGLGLIGEEGTRPTALPVAADTAETVAIETAAIGFAQESGDRPQSRVLVGDVVDPAFGDVQATAYLDAVQPSAIDGDLEADEVRAVWVELRREYAYGDTTTTLPLALRQISGSASWEADPSYPADTTLATGDVLATATATTAPADTLVRFDLPEAWVRENAATFLSDEADFLREFEGFAVGTAEGFVPAPGVVYGFSTLARLGTRIRVAVPDDTLDFGLGEVFSSIRHEAPVAPPPTALPARSSTAGAALHFDFSEVGPLPLARAALRVPIESGLMEEGAFVRPVAQRVLVEGVRADGGRRVLGEIELVGGELRPTVLAAPDFTDVLQDALVEESETGVPVYRRFEFIFPSAAPALNVFPVVRPDAPQEAVPRFSLTVIGGPSA
jgi:hypothetical protein